MESKKAESMIIESQMEETQEGKNGSRQSSNKDLKQLVADEEVEVIAGLSGDKNKL